MSAKSQKLQALNKCIMDQDSGMYSVSRFFSILGIKTQPRWTKQNWHWFQLCGLSSYLLISPANAGLALVPGHTILNFRTAVSP